MQQAIKRNIIKRNNVKVMGYGTQAMIFAAGFGCDQNMWRYIVPAFANDYRVVLFDYVGAGESDLSAYCPDKYGSLHGYAQDVIDVLTALDITDAIFVGHSVGCVIGLLASLREPERFDRSVMIGPSPCYLNEEGGYQGGFERASLEGLLDMMKKNDLGWASFLAPVIMRNEDRPELTEELKTSFCSTDPVIAHNFAKVTFFSDNREDLPKATVPSLILQSEEDAIAPIGVGEYMRDNTPNSTYRLLAATGHCPHMSHPEAIIAAMRDYLVGQTPAGRQRTSSELHQLPCGFLSFTLEGRIHAVNDRLLGWLGFTSDELQNAAIDTVLTPSSRLFHQMFFFPMIRLHGKAEGVHMTLLGRDGTELPVQLNGVCRNIEGQLLVECLILSEEASA
ncbi:alpha/beta fold hydrolase [Billgrantia sp. LNSP4103-1]|uniref:alpha/beta fold hydrolase n=1 Tax=Billgrantia sp. LNSP4103-1 TaxID=3410266 RepID=UPI00403F6F78